MGYTINVSSYEIDADPDVLRGLPSELTEVPEVVPVEGSNQEGAYTEIVVPEFFPPGSVMLFETQVSGVDPKMDAFCAEGVEEAFSNLDLVDLNILLYRAGHEEEDAWLGLALQEIFNFFLAEVTCARSTPA